MAKVLSIKVLRFETITEIDLVMKCLNYVPFSNEVDRQIRGNLLNVLKEIKESMENLKESETQEEESPRE